MRLYATGVCFVLGFLLGENMSDRIVNGLVIAFLGFICLAVIVE